MFLCNCLLCSGSLLQSLSEFVGDEDVTKIQDYKLSFFRIVGLIGEGSFGSVYEAAEPTFVTSVGSWLGPTTQKKYLPKAHRFLKEFPRWNPW